MTVAPDFLINYNLASWGPAAISPAVLPVGVIVGKTVVPAQKAYAIPALGNVGLAALTLEEDSPVGANVLNGDYSVVLQSGGPAATFRILNATGGDLGGGSFADTSGLEGSPVGVRFRGVLKFTLTATGPMVAGDRWTIKVTPTTADLWSVLDTSQSNGLEIAAGVFAGDAGGTPGRGLVAYRNAKILLSALIWPVGFTAAQIAKAVGQLRTVGLVAV